jgi:FMN-dependent oxidoreductase (nitrilotriacetate monooxygenase family)
MKNLILGAFQTMNPNGTIGASWRVPGNTDVRYLDLDHWTGLGKRLEEGGFDFLFFADSYGYPMIDGEVIPTALTDAMYIPMADPITVVSAVAAATERLGLVVTSSTTVERPASVARRYGTLDHFTRGRIGWNIVTGAAQASSAELFGEPMIAHDERYAQAEDHLAICLGLWEGSWDDDALVQDADAGVYARPDGVRAVEYEGRHLRSRGVFGIPPSPQRSPLLLQAGTSVAGRDFAARYAEVVFIGGGDADLIRDQIADIRRRAEAAGRSADALRFLVGAHFVAAATTEEAEHKRAEMVALATLEQAATTYAWVTGIDLTALPLDEPMPDLRTEQGQSSVDRFMDPASGRRKTVRQVLEEYRDNGINGTVFVGNGLGIADQVAAFVDRTDADGFLVQPHVTPQTYDDFVVWVAPALRAAGLLHAEGRAGNTLRDRLLGAGSRLPASHPAATYRRFRTTV